MPGKRKAPRPRKFDPDHEIETNNNAGSIPAWVNEEAAKNAYDDALRWHKDREEVRRVRRQVQKTRSEVKRLRLPGHESRAKREAIADATAGFVAAAERLERKLKPLCGKEQMRNAEGLLATSMWDGGRTAGEIREELGETEKSLSDDALTKRINRFRSQQHKG